MPKEFRISSIKEILEIVEKFGMSADFVYRGQKLTYPKLTTSLERHVDNEITKKYKHQTYPEIGFGSLYGIECQIIRAFQQGVHHYADSPAESDYIQWLALMQHHGSPTRLLDVTRSLFVALYFAVSHDDDTDGVIYSFFDLNWYYKKEEYEPDYFKANRYLKSSFEIKHKQLVPISELPLQVINVKPLQLNKRQIAQQGEFLMPSRVDRSFEENLSATHSLKLNNEKFDYGDPRIPNPENPITKIIIPRDQFAEIRLILTHMNITTASLFPDLDGFSKSMHEIAKQWRGGNLS